VLQVDHQSPETILFQSPLLKSGTLRDAVAALRTFVPAQYLQQDLATIRSSDTYDNSTIQYGPDGSGNQYTIKHSRALNFRFQHDCQATVQRKRIQHDNERNKICGFRLAAQRSNGRQVVVFTNSGRLGHQTLWEGGLNALAAANAFGKVHGLPSNPDEACNEFMSKPTVIQALTKYCNDVLNTPLHHECASSVK